MSAAVTVEPSHDRRHRGLVLLAFLAATLTVVPATLHGPNGNLASAFAAPPATRIPRNTPAISGFGIPAPPPPHPSPSARASTAGTTNELTRARDDVLSTARTIAADSPTGALLLSSSGAGSDSERLNRAVAELEALSSTSAFTERERALAVGDWTLVCTSTTFRTPSPPSKRRRRSPFPPFFPELPTVRDALRRSLTITQRIRSMAPADGPAGATVIDRVDNVIEFAPPSSLRDLLPGARVDVNINPLGVSGSRIALVHDAEVESLVPVFRTRIGLKSVVLTVAGTSRYLDPEGSDIFGLNIPSVADDLSGSGTFDTTYVDELVRISRGKAIQGSNGSGTTGVGGETLRVFVRAEGTSPGLVRSEEEEVGSGSGGGGSEGEEGGIGNGGVGAEVVQGVDGAVAEEGVVIDAVDAGVEDGSDVETATAEDDGEVDVSDGTAPPPPPPQDV